MDYYQKKLAAFIIYLRKTEPELEKRVHQLSVDDKGILKSIGSNSSEEDWKKTSEYWNNFNA